MLQGPLYKKCAELGGGLAIPTLCAQEEAGEDLLIRIDRASRRQSGLDCGANCPSGCCSGDFMD